MADTEYISKDSALACFSDWIDRYGHEHTADEMVEYQRIEDLLPADVVEVVRCKNCKWWAKSTNSAQGQCIISNMLPTGEYYCGSGRKREKPDWSFCPNCGADMTPPSNGEK